MNCRYCDKQNPDDARFCAKCGARLDVRCQQCGQHCQADATFCIWCGSVLTPDQPLRGEKVERKQATVLFVDIVNSTQLVAGLDAETAMLRLRPIIATLSKAVRRFGGTIVRSLGDGLKVAFGAPRALEGHAILACQSALAMQQAIRAMKNGPAVRIGLHSGEVVAGDIDTGFTVEQATQGMTVHIASRMEQLAEPGGICMSDACFQLVRAFFETVPLGLQALRGVVAPMPVHRLVGTRPAISSIAFRSTALSPLRSRELELSALEQAMAEALRSAPPVVGIVAAPGVGKSRLCFEFSERCRRRGIYVMEAHCFLHGQVMPMMPIIEMTRTYFQIRPSDQGIAVRETLAARLRLLDEALLPDAWLLSHLLGARDDDDPPLPADPRVAQARLHAFFRRIIQSAGREPGLLVFEDLHWIDPVSEAMLAAMIEAAADTQIMVMVNFRPGFCATWMDTPRYRELALDELDHSDTELLVGTLVGDAPEVAPIRAEVAARSGGNPFFAEELVSSLEENGVLAGVPGRYQAGPNWQRTTLPASIEAVLGARLDCLPVPAKAVLQVGAIIGKEFPVALLRDVTGHDQADLEALLERLVAAGVIVERSTAIGRCFGFRHPLFQEVAYNTQLRIRRRELHGAVARAMEDQPWAQTDSLAGWLAHHSSAGGDSLGAARHLQRSASWIGRTDSAQALRQWKEIRTLLNEVPDSDNTKRLRAQASAQVLNFGWREGITLNDVRPYAEEAVGYARGVNDTVHGPMLLASYGRIVVAHGAADEYVALAREALSMRANDIDVRRNIMLHGVYAQALAHSGQLHAAVRAIEAGLALLVSTELRSGYIDQGFDFRRLIGFEPEHWLRALHTRVLVSLGQFAEAEAAIHVIEDVEERQDEAMVVRLIPHLAAVELGYWTGQAGLAERHAEVLRAHATQAQLPYVRVVSLLADALAAAAGGRFKRSIDALREALTSARGSRAGLEFEPSIMSALAEFTHRTGAIVEAAALARTAIGAGLKRSQRVPACHANLVYAHALLDIGGRSAINRVEPLLARAEELIDETGAVILTPMLRGLLAQRDELR